MNNQSTNSKPIFYGWWIVIICMVGISTGPAPFMVGSLGVFMKPLAAEFGWTRAVFSSTLTVMTILAAICFPIIGRLLDRYGVKAVLLPCMFMFALCLAAIPTFVNQFWHYMALIVLIGILGSGANTISYIPLLSTWFDKRRGLAIGIGVSGIGLGFLYVPVLVQFMIDNYGWRSGYYALSGLILFISIPMIWKWLRNSPADIGLNPDGATNISEDKQNYMEIGMKPKEVLQTKEFWMLIIIFTTSSFVLNGCMAHMVPMLTDRQMPGSSAAIVAASVGSAAFISRIVIGYLVDHFFAPHIAFIALLLSTIGLGMFAAGASGFVAAIAAAVMIGISYGAELDLMGYLITRYFGLRYCGSNYGLLLIGIILGGGFAPLFYGIWHDIATSYIGILIISTVANAIIAIMAVMLGPYPEWAKTQQNAA